MELSASSSTDEANEESNSMTGSDLVPDGIRSEVDVVDDIGEKETEEVFNEVLEVIKHEVEDESQSSENQPVLKEVKVTLEKLKMKETKSKPNRTKKKKAVKNQSAPEDEEENNEEEIEKAEGNEAKPKKRYNRRKRKYCFVPDCESPQDQSYHRFPLPKSKLHKQWVAACKIKVPNSYKSWHNNRICGKHFVEEDFNLKQQLRGQLLGEKVTKLLNRDAIPSLNLPKNEKPTRKLSHYMAQRLDEESKKREKEEAEKKVAMRKKIIAEILKEDQEKIEKQKRAEAKRIQAEKIARQKKAHEEELNALKGDGKTSDQPPIAVMGPFSQPFQQSSVPQMIPMPLNSPHIQPGQYRCRYEPKSVSLQDEINEIEAFLRRKMRRREIEECLPGLEKQLVDEQIWFNNKMFEKITECETRTDEQQPETGNSEDSKTPEESNSLTQNRATPNKEGVKVSKTLKKAKPSRTVVSEEKGDHNEKSTQQTAINDILTESMKSAEIDSAEKEQSPSDVETTRQDPEGPSSTAETTRQDTEGPSSTDETSVMKISRTHPDGSSSVIELKLTTEDKIILDGQQEKIILLERKIDELRAEKIVLEIHSHKDNKNVGIKDYLKHRVWTEIEKRKNYEESVKEMREENRKLKIKMNELNKKIKAFNDPKVKEDEFKKTLKSKCSPAMYKLIMKKQEGDKHLTNFQITDEEYTNFFMLRRISVKAYEFLRLKGLLPLPSRSSVWGNAKRLEIAAPEHFAALRDSQTPKVRKKLPDPLAPKPKKKEKKPKREKKKVIKKKKIRRNIKRKLQGNKSAASPKKRKNQTNTSEEDASPTKRSRIVKKKKNPPVDPDETDQAIQSILNDEHVVVATTNSNAVYQVPSSSSSSSSHPEYHGDHYYHIQGVLQESDKTPLPKYLKIGDTFVLLEQ